MTHRRWASLVVLLTLVAYWPAVRSPFELDDVASIPENATIRRVWPPSIPLRPPGGGLAVSGRPIVNYSLALNHALNERLGVDQRPDPNGPNKTISYHVVNLLLHLMCGALIFGIVRRTLRSPRLPAGWAAVADPFAAIVVTVWLIHPIQTEAVSYVIQRTELIVSACYAGTVYASLRAWDASSSRARAAWYTVAVMVCLLGMGSKEVMITAPLMVLLYDRTFRLTSWKGVIQGERGWFYGALAVTSVWSIALIAGGARTHTVGLNLGIT